MKDFIQMLCLQKHIVLHFIDCLLNFVFVFVTFFFESKKCNLFKPFLFDITKVSLSLSLSLSGLCLKGVSHFYIFVSLHLVCAVWQP